MSNLATKDNWLASTERRFTEITLPQVGRARIRSLTTSEYAKVEAIATRAAIALNQKKKADAQRLFTDAKVTLVTLCVVDNAGAPVFNAADAEKLKGLDYGVLSAAETACAEHCGVDGIDLEATGKD